jgi:hypothetical protein
MSRTQAALSPPASLLATSAIQMGCGPTPAILAWASAKTSSKERQPIAGRDSPQL